jgi:ABC-type polysaccharide transport system permease subunit
MELLGTYSLRRINEKNYELIYDIPDNCNFSVADKDGVYVITIELKNGQTQPSTKFITEKTTCTAFDKIIEIKFTQENYLVLNATFKTKPKIRIDINE